MDVANDAQWNACRWDTSFCLYVLLVVYCNYVGVSDGVSDQLYFAVFFYPYLIEG